MISPTNGATIQLPIKGTGFSKTLNNLAVAFAAELNAEFSAVNAAEFTAEFSAVNAAEFAAEFSAVNAAEFTAEFSTIDAAGKIAALSAVHTGNLKLKFPRFNSGTRGEEEEIKKVEEEFSPSGRNLLLGTAPENNASTA